jgi:hypothetical protein
MTTQEVGTNNSGAQRTGFIAKITWLTAAIVAVLGLYNAVDSVVNKTQPLLCKAFGIWCLSNSDPGPNSDPIKTGLAAGSTGWIYVGTRIGNEWKTSSKEGSEPALTIETGGLPRPGGTYKVIKGVYMRVELPQSRADGGRPTMPDSKGAIAQGGQVKIDDVREIKLSDPNRSWIWAHVTLLR